MCSQSACTSRRTSPRAERLDRQPAALDHAGHAELFQVSLHEMGLELVGGAVAWLPRTLHGGGLQPATLTRPAEPWSSRSC